MCESCNKKSCSGGCKQSTVGKDIGSLVNLVNELSNTLDQVKKDTAFLKDGHPIMMLQNADDISLFSFETGLGSKKWEGWAICNGGTYQNATTGVDFQTPELLNRFPVAAGDTYSVNDTGGLDGVILNETELPAHTHPITDPGHTHDIQDPGHTHAGSSASHSHSLSMNPHTHVVGTDGEHSHALNPSVFDDSNNGGTGPFAPAVGSQVLGEAYGGLRTNTDGAHTHALSSATSTGSIGGTSSVVTVVSAFTGIGETVINDTNISIGETGSGIAHENRPPFYALLFIMKL